MQALGMIETKGTLALIEAADAMLKTADVHLLNKERVTGGLMMVSVIGDVAAAKAAVDAGKSAVEKLDGNLLYGTHVIPRPDTQLERLLKETSKASSEKKTEEKSEIKGYSSLEEAIEAKDKAAIQEFFEETTLAELRKFVETQGIEIPDLQKITKKKLIEALVEHFMQD